MDTYQASITGSETWIGVDSIGATCMQPPACLRSMLECRLYQSLNQLQYIYSPLGPPDKSGRALQLQGPLGGVTWDFVNKSTLFMFQCERSSPKVWAQDPISWHKCLLRHVSCSKVYFSSSCWHFARCCLRFAIYAKASDLLSSAHPMKTNQSRRDIRYKDCNHGERPVQALPVQSSEEEGMEGEGRE